MTPSEADLITQARLLFEQRRAIDRQLAEATGAQRRRLWSQRKRIVAQICQLPEWALNIASGSNLEHALRMAQRNRYNPGAQRLIRWAEARYQ